MKKLRSVALLVGGAVCAATLGMAACGPKIPDTADALEIYCWDAGYGVQWCTDIIAIFKEQDWVKEKYPNLEVYFASNDTETFASSKLSAGSRANSYDLLFGSQLYGYAGPNGSLLDLTDVVYNAQVPGETVLYKDKMNKSYRASNKYFDTTNQGTEKYYMLSWAGGMDSIIYNETFFDELGYSVPNTTDELAALCASYKANSAHNGYSFIQSRGDDYWQYLFPIWWAQYEGIDNYLNFWNGIVNDAYSTAIFDQKGREYSLGVYENLLKYNKGYVNPAGFTQTFMVAQTNFLRGESLMHVNGDWFSSEMRTIMGEVDNGYVFKTMRMPIVSALGEKLGITDAELSAIVSYVDAVAAGESATEPAFTSTKGYSTEKVVGAVREARTIVHSIGPAHTAVVPSYATAKDAAVDFLRFMGTDVALNAYTKATYGASLPMDYTVDATLYSQLSTAQQSRIDYFQSGLDIYVLPAPQAFPLARYGGLDAFVTQNYFSTFYADGNSKTPADYMRETKNAWTESKFQEALNAAGLR